MRRRQDLRHGSKETVADTHQQHRARRIPANEDAIRGGRQEQTTVPGGRRVTNYVVHNLRKHQAAEACVNI